MKHIKTNYLYLIPLLGILIYFILFYYSAKLYPGGTNLDKNSIGFSFLNNYWCELLNSKGKNGEINIAKPFAISAMLILTLSLSVFWLFLPILFNYSTKINNLLRFSGVLSMFISNFIFTNLHDFIINVAGASGLIAMALTLNGLYKTKQSFLLIFGLFSLLLMAINSIIYNTGLFFYLLAVLQKITIFVVLFWVVLLNFKIIEKQKALNFRDSKT